MIKWSRFRIWNKSMRMSEEAHWISLRKSNHSIILDSKLTFFQDKTYLLWDLKELNFECWPYVSKKKNLFKNYGGLIINNYYDNFLSLDIFFLKNCVSFWMKEKEYFFRVFVSVSKKLKKKSWKGNDNGRLIIVKIWTWEKNIGWYS